MIALQQTPDGLPLAAVSSLFSWDFLKDSYCLYFMTDPATSVCLMAYIVVTLFLIIFLLQPKAARTWVRHSGKSKGAPSPRIDSPTQIADLYNMPVRTAGVHEAASLPNEPRSMPPLPQRPVQPVARQDKVSLQPSSATAHSAAVLYVTDSDGAEHLIDSLGGAGMAVISSLPGKEAVRNITVTKFDIIVIDTLVAEASRLCATRILEALPPKPQVPVLIILNHPGQTLNIAATNARIDYLFRPFDDNFLVAKVNLMVQQRPAESNTNEKPMSPSMPYDKHMEKLVESLPAVVDGIQEKSEQNTMNGIELQSGFIAFIGEETAASLNEKLKGDNPPLAEEIRKTAEQVDELLRLCATIKPPKPQK
jgi:DNA-binding response OmpR family regulator